MLGFTLSKLNLLILVTALFAIITFFMFRLTDIMVSRSAQQMVNDYVETVAGITSGDSLCFKHTMTLPESISYFGGIQQSKRFYYIVEVSREPREYDPEYISKVIFKVASRKEQDKFIATDSFDLNAQIYLYQWPTGEGMVLDDIEMQGTVKLDPKSIAVADSMVLVKELFAGKNYLHIIVCSSAGEQCSWNVGYAGCCIKKLRGGVESTCLEPAEDCDTLSLTC